MEVLVQDSHSQDLLIFLYKLYQGKLLCDIDLESEDGVTFSTHRTVLASTSTYVHHVLLLKPGLSSLKLDVPSKVLQILLDYSYTGQLFVSSSLRKDIEAAATFLQMYSVLGLLKRNCGEEQVNEPVCDDVDSVLKTYTGQYDSTDKTTNVDSYEVAIKVENLDPETAAIDSALRNMGQSNYIISTEEVGKMIGTRYKKRVTKNKTKTKASQKNSRRKCSKERKKGSSSGEKRATPTSWDKLIDCTLRITNCNLSHEDDSVQDTRKLKRMKKSENSLCDGTTSPNKHNKTNAKEYWKDQHNMNLDKYKSCRNRSKSLREGDYCPKTKTNSLKVVITCLYCAENLPPSLLYCQHMMECHSQIYLKLLYCRFLIKRSLRCLSTAKHLSLHTRFNKSHHCHLCAKKFDTFTQFYIHFTNDHVQKKRRTWYSFLSFFLKRKFNTKSIVITENTVAVSQTKRLKCLLCGKGYWSKSGLNAHIKKCHRDQQDADNTPKKPVISKLLNCYLCNKGMQSEESLRNHLVKTHRMSAAEAKRNQFELTSCIECEVATCQFSSTNILDMNQHVTSLHPYIQHHCGKCMQVFQHKVMLERHMLSTHSGRRKKPKPECRTCGRTFPKAHNLRRHEYFKHGIEHDSVRVYRCDEEGCTFVTSTSTALRLHGSKHTREKKFTCEFCGLKLKTEISHKKHINKMHLGIRPYLCQVCGQSFGESHELKSHFSYKHTTERQYKCQYCGYATGAKSTYHTHLFNVHKIRDKDDKRTEYQCSLCPFKSILLNRYKLHMKSHTNTREYWCNLCNKSFITPSTLLAHKQWMHSENVFSCMQCEYKTKTRAKLNEHIRIQHQLKGLRPYKCSYCEFRCATGGNTRKHVKQVHPGFEVKYHRDDRMLRAARDARAIGHHEPLVFPNKSDDSAQNGNTVTTDSGQKIP